MIMDLLFWMLAENSNKNIPRNKKPINFFLNTDLEKIFIKNS
jgi:hypothetical protein